MVIGSISEALASVSSAARSSATASALTAGFQMRYLGRKVVPLGVLRFGRRDRRKYQPAPHQSELTFAPNGTFDLGRMNQWAE